MLQEVNLSLFFDHVSDISLHVLRLDAENVITGGNKQYKLKYNLEAAKAQGKKNIVTLGGAYSNHIAATARKCRDEKLQSTGIIRGEETKSLNITLERARADGMKLLFVSRTFYHQLRTADTATFLTLIAPLLQQNGINASECYMVPEGGNNDEGFRGSTEILDCVNQEFDVVCCAAGTGTTLAGITAALKPNQNALGIAAVRDFDFINNNVISYLGNEELPFRYKLITDYTFGGFAKSNKELRQFIQHFTALTSIPTEPVYSGKMFFAVIQMIKSGYFNAGSRILCVHSGGMQYLDA